MKLDHIPFIKLSLLVAVLSIAGALFFGSTTSAYTCENGGKNGKVPFEQGEYPLRYENGACYFDAPYKEIPKKPTINPDGTLGAGRCPDGSREHDDKTCWEYKKRRTNIQPTLDNGQQVPREVWDDLCRDKKIKPGGILAPSQFDVNAHYNAERHACEVGAGCSTGGSVLPGLSEIPFIGDNYDTCMLIGDDTEGPNVEDTTDNPNDPDGQNNSNNDKDGDGVADPITESIKPVATKCGQEARVNILACGESDSAAETMTSLLRIAVIVLSFIVGIAAVGGLAWASVLYAKAQDNEGNVSEAKTLIRNIVIGLLLYVFLVALTNYLIPGGVFGSGGGSWW